MKELLDKLSTYNIFNYLLPGIVFVVLSESVLRRSFLMDDLVIGLFVYYFIGLVISRVGSLLIEPILKKLNLIRFASYAQYLAAAQKDEKIDILLELNNMYRSLSSLFLSLLILWAYEQIEYCIPALEKFTPLLLVALLLLLFIASYRKQTSYLVKRIEQER